jgi:polysaccharide export outer membrane protein
VAVEAYRSQRVFVVGEVKTPGHCRLTGGLTLMEAIARAGSTTERSQRRRRDRARGPRCRTGRRPIRPASKAAGKTVVRVNLRRLQQGAAGVRCRMATRCSWAVSSPFYVYGQVKSPGSYPVRAQTTLLQALSLAGGGTPTAAVNRARSSGSSTARRKEYRITSATWSTRATPSWCRSGSSRRGAR